MIVMPANATGGFWMTLAVTTGRLGHLYSPGEQKGPWPWFPYALDCGVFTLWNPADNTFDEARWLSHGLEKWRRLLFWSQAAPEKPLWVIVPDRPGAWNETVRKWPLYAAEVVAAGFPLAAAVQNGATPDAVRTLNPQPYVVCVGGDTDWKWSTAEQWLREFPGRVHILRCNSPQKLHWLEAHGCMSCDGTGWNRGDRTQTRGIEEWARSRATPYTGALYPYCSRARRRDQETFA